MTSACSAYVLQLFNDLRWLQNFVLLLLFMHKVFLDCTQFLRPMEDVDLTLCLDSFPVTINFYFSMLNFNLFNFIAHLCVSNASFLLSMLNHLQTSISMELLS